MVNRRTITKLLQGAIALLMGLALMPVAAAASNAEIVLLQGRGDKRESEAAPWTSAAVKQTVPPGGFVRTLANSQMGLLLGDRTQIRLNQNSQMQIKTVADAATWEQTTVRLNSGRAWSQARPQAQPVSPQPATRLQMETPSATMSIRGTDWEVEILPDNSTQLVVLSGTVGMANEFGALELAPGEAALAAPGRAPVKIQLINPRQRVQWVSYWKAQPVRWGGADADATARLAADQQMLAGEISRAVALLEPLARGGAGEAQTVALLARIWAREDRTAAARSMLLLALQGKPGNVELLLAAGDLAALDGDTKAARAAYAAVLTQSPDSANAWYGIGLIESGRENVDAAREALGRARRDVAVEGLAVAELAAVETFAGRLPEGRAFFDEAIKADPSDFAAWTASGINLLKSGQPQEALNAFLKAGTIEPRYARAWFYSGVAFYQLQERDRARQAFARAAELDPRDPLPHLVMSLVAGDALQYGDAIVAAREAQARMPYLKSLNQIANDQKGSANLGTSLANFGMEEWAGFYAYESSTPFWAGSHLFLADRYTGKFNKNSELFQGFLTDPTAFGASNRFSSVVAVPGHYAKLDVFSERASWKQNAIIGTVNGMSAEPTPLAYFFSADASNAQSRIDPSNALGTNFTLGVGARPSHKLGLFAFATETVATTDIVTNSTLARDLLEQKDSRLDVGFNYKFRPDNQVWFKVGDGRQTSEMWGAYVSQATATSLNRRFLTNIFRAGGQLNQYKTVNRTDDIQMRHAFGDEQFLRSWGLERSRFDRPGDLTTTFRPVALAFTQAQAMSSTDLYVSGKWRRQSAFSAQADVWLQSGKMERRDRSTLDVLTTAALDTILQDDRREQRYADINPRLGLSWYPAPQQAVRLVSQRWRRPAAISTLAPVETEGVPVNDRLIMAGGLYRRTRLQAEGEFGNRWYGQFFLDREQFDNGINGMTSVVPNLDQGQLETLRNRREVFTPVADIEDVAEFSQGIVNTVGMAANVLVQRNHSFSLRYLNRGNRQLGTAAGLAIPYVPRHFFRAASQWALPDRWLVGANATYRSVRFKDNANAQLLRQGWAFGLTAYWESADKRASLQGILDNLLTDKGAGTSNKSHLTVRYTYRF